MLGPPSPKQGCFSLSDAPSVLRQTQSRVGEQLCSAIAGEGGTTFWGVSPLPSQDNWYAGSPLPLPVWGAEP